MGTAAMGRVVVSAKIENMQDLLSVHQGRLAIDQVRALEVPDALVDTGATFLSLPKRLIDQLGLVRFQTKRARTSGGIVEFGVYASVRLTIQDRDCHVDVAEVPEDCPVLIGQIPLELLDYLVDSTRHRLVGNPDHGGEHMFDMF